MKLFELWMLFNLSMVTLIHFLQMPKQEYLQTDYALKTDSALCKAKWTQLILLNFYADIPTTIV